MDMVAAVQRRVMTRAAAIGLFLAVMAALSGRWPAALGVLAGCFVALLNFRLLALSTIKVLEMDPRAAQIQAFVHYFIRYALTVAVLFSINFNPDLDVFAAVVGLLSVKIVILGEAVITYTKQRIQSGLDPSRWERGEK